MCKNRLLILFIFAQPCRKTLKKVNMRFQRLVQSLVQVHLPIFSLLNLHDKFIEGDLSIDVEYLLKKKTATPEKLASLNSRANGFVVLPVGSLTFGRAVVGVVEFDDVDSAGRRIFASCARSC
jgi:hypothetical protein